MAWNVWSMRSIPSKPNASFTPKWSEKPLLKSWEKTKPPLGWPRTTDSLCPKCVPEMRKKDFSMVSSTVDVLHRTEKMRAKIKAQIINRDGKILMVEGLPDSTVTSKT